MHQNYGDNLTNREIQSKGQLMHLHNYEGNNMRVNNRNNNERDDTRVSNNNDNDIDNSNSEDPIHNL